MSYQEFCDADTIATFIFNWVFGIVVLATVTSIFHHNMIQRKLIREKRENVALKKQSIERMQGILDEIIKTQKALYVDYENSKTELERQHIVRAYDEIERCLSKLTITASAESEQVKAFQNNKQDFDNLSKSKED